MRRSGRLGATPSQRRIHLPCPRCRGPGQSCRRCQFTAGPDTGDTTSCAGISEQIGAGTPQDTAALPAQECGGILGHTACGSARTEHAAFAFSYQPTSMAVTCSLWAESLRVSAFLPVTGHTESARRSWRAPTSTSSPAPTRGATASTTDQQRQPPRSTLTEPSCRPGRVPAHGQDPARKHRPAWGSGRS
jgi:hypothetical protein